MRLVVPVTPFLRPLACRCALALALTPCLAVSSAQTAGPAQTARPAQTPAGDDAANAGAPNSQPTGGPGRAGGGGGSRARTPTGAALSPDGATVAWSVREGTATTLHLSPMAGTDAARTAKDQIVAPGGATSGAPGGATDCANTAPVWSPDGTTLAFTSTCAGTGSGSGSGSGSASGKTDEAGQEQIFLWSKADGKVRQLTHLKGNIQQAAWSPDGKSIAFLFVENATRSAGALDAMKPWAGVIGEDGIEVQTVALIEDINQGANLVDKLTVFPVRPQLHAFEFTWAPDSKHIAFVGAPAPGENNWWIAQLYTVPVPGRSGDSAHLDAPKSILDPTTVAGPLHGLQIAVPRYSPDGKEIAFIGGLMSDQGSTGGDVYLVSSSGGTPTNITPRIDGTPAFIDWLAPNTLGIVEDRRGHTLLLGWDVGNKTILEGGLYDLGFASLSGGALKDAVSPGPNNTLALVKSSLTAPAEVWAGTPDDLHQITHLNDGATRKSAHIESVEWENDGFHIQGWLTFPSNYDPHRAAKYPLIVTVHGGPSASAFPRGAQFADAGYFEFQPNPRGSYGQARPSSRPTARTSAMATCATSSRAWTRWRPSTPSTRPARASPDGAMAAS